MKQFAILGYPLGHSLSPQLHKMLAEELGEELSYHVFEISPEEFDQKKAELFSLDGFNITIPYKVRIMDSLDELDQSAKNHGAVNTVSIKNGLSDKTKTGFNTDCVGFVKTMEQNGVSLSGRVCLLGPRGTSAWRRAPRRAHPATECALRGCEVVIAVRQKSMKEVQELAEHIHDISGAKVSVADIDTLGQGDTGRFQLLINATPVGMYPKAEASPVKEEFLSCVDTVFDCIYNPKETLLMKKANKAGCKTIGGMGMLVWQAVAAQEIWFGKKFTFEQVSRVIKAMQNLL